MKSYICFFSLLLTMFLFNHSTAQEAKDIALVIKVQGQAFVKSGDADWQNLQQGRRLHSGDFVKTGDETMIAIVFTDDKSMIKIRSNTQIQFDGERDDKNIKKTLKMTLGQIWSKINPRGAGYQIVTPSGVAAVRGTEFYSIVDANGTTTIIGISGSVALFNQINSVLVTAGKTGSVEKEKAPTLADTVGFEPWAASDDTADTLEIEFQDVDGNTKKLKLKY